MSRKDLFNTVTKEVTTNNLEEKLNMYIDKKTLADSLAKEVKSLGEDIKQLMEENGETKLSQNGYSFSCTERNTTKVDEEKLINVLKKNNIKATKMKEIIDEEVLESMIYNGQLSKEVLSQIQGCQKTTTTKVLSMRKGK